MSTAATPPQRLRVRSGLQFVQSLRPALYALLVASALFTFWAGGDIAGHALPGWTRAVAPALFAVFLVVFAVYRLALVRAKRYPAAVGLFQIGLGALIWVLLLPGSRRNFAREPAADDLPALLSYPDPRVRALAAEVAGQRPTGSRYAAKLVDHLTDSDERVARAAHESLVHITGTDAGSPEAWRALLKQRGW